MTELFNQVKEKAKRRTLRNNSPKAEIILWQKLRRKNIEGIRFRRQVSIGKYVVDFYCPKRKLVIEIDGESHFTEIAKQYDVARKKYFEGLGLHEIRFLNSDIYSSLPGVLEEILQKIKSLK